MSSDPRTTASQHEIVDLRSDTLTQPTAEMRAAMMAAEVGDDVYGEDPTARALEEETAATLGKESAVFTPSGTMANQIAILLHTRPGDSVICEEGAHVYLYEAGGGAALAGVQFDLVPLPERMSDPAVEARCRREELHAATTTLLCVENTHNRAAGRVLTAREMTRIAAKAHALGLRAHCDGARLWNAAVAAGEAERDLVAGFDTVAVCFSKGLGAPVGSAVAGTAEAMARARKLRKRLGGGMRQAGVLAAAALFGLRARSRLAEDHRRAAMLARGLRGLSAPGRAIDVQISDLPTNMVYWRLQDVDGDALVLAFARRGVRLLHVGGGWLRAVTHLGITDAGIARALDCAHDVCQA
ncbi:MAG: aminotransferase class I/II-fold pyridoxal phosphate-dependent enzyme [Betaproteobacteria bacterium]|nr:aminotransferase class I/II-fold pyridoxal phosphate-dependent enzyme [Betaproteobacteria bacterium]MDH3436027.1 aminotransferase class I/II-fold pyridoxal phosphate-dependent enzyme [Betaproteobacteria bacterium]